MPTNDKTEDLPQHGLTPMVIVNELARLSTENERLRVALEQYADTSNWVGREWRGEGNGWVLGQRVL